MRNRSNRAYISIIGLSLAGLSMIGCKEPAPSDYQQNMGVDGAPLLAVGNARTVVAVASGQAEWIEFRDPNEVAKEPTTEDNDNAADTDGVEQEIRDLIKDYNEVVLDRDIDEVLDFFVETQREALKPVLKSMFDIADRLAKQRETISSQLPDAADRIALAFSKLGPVAQAKLEVTSIMVVEDGQANGTLPPGSLTTTCRFVLEDEDWYIEYAPDELAAQSTSVLGTLEKLLTSIEGSQSSADELLAAIEGARSAEGETATDEPESD